MADDVLRIERRERIAILTLNRPDRLNALSVELREALTCACQELRDDDNVWSVVLTGAGRGFCSGGRFAHATCGRKPATPSSHAAPPTSPANSPSL